MSARPVIRLLLLAAGPRLIGAALAAAARVMPTVLPCGKLGLNEEFAGDVALAIVDRPIKSE